MGPLVQGRERSRARRLRVVAVFALSFLGASLLTFAIVGGFGILSGLVRAPAGLRVGLAAAGLAAFSFVDVVAIRRDSYCPLGLRRQTPRTLLRFYRTSLVAAVWGVDTGLVVTTFRVSAMTWAALLLSLLGLAPMWVGSAYAVGFIGPFVLLAFGHRVGASARTADPTDPGLQSMLGRRKLVQAVSAGLLVTGACALILDTVA